MTLPRLLIVEAHRQTATRLRHHLEVEGFAVDVVADRGMALDRIRAQRPDCVLLSTAVAAHGYQALRTIRGEDRIVPIVMLASQSDEAQTVRGLALGADDYVARSAGVREVVARVRAVLRRTGPSIEEPSRIWRFGAIEVDLEVRRVRRGGESLPLRPKEYDLLVALLLQRGRVVSRGELLRTVWGYHSATVSRTVDSHVALLRRKLEQDPLRPEYLLTVRSAGYMLQRATQGIERPMP